MHSPLCPCGGGRASAVWVALGGLMVWTVRGLYRAHREVAELE